MSMQTKYYVNISSASLMYLIIKESTLKVSVFDLFKISKHTHTHTHTHTQYYIVPGPVYYLLTFIEDVSKSQSRQLQGTA